jgi:hypothetical protein
LHMAKAIPMQSGLPALGPASTNQLPERP